MRPRRPNADTSRVSRATRTDFYSNAGSAAQRTAKVGGARRPLVTASAIRGAPPARRGNNRVPAPHGRIAPLRTLLLVSKMFQALFLPWLVVHHCHGRIDPTFRTAFYWLHHTRTPKSRKPDTNSHLPKSHYLFGKIYKATTITERSQRRVLVPVAFVAKDTWLQRR